MDRYELAWAAGFFDGEGWAARVENKKRGTRYPMARINQAGDAGVPEVLIRFRHALGGLGSIGGPDRVPQRRDLYRWVVSSQPDLEALYDLISPYAASAKLTQLANAALRPTRASAIPDGDDVWWAWAGGLWDGEGCSALLKHRTHQGYLTPELSVTQSSGVGSPEVLRRFAAIVGLGAISGPYAQRNATMDVYRWKASARTDAERVLAGLWPFIGSVKRQQAQRLLDTLAAQPVLPRGNPAWGNNKTHCVNGHEYASMRIRPFKSRNGGAQPRANSQCLGCLREYAQKKRLEKKGSSVEDTGSVSDVLVEYAATW